jgi:threonine aldolase
VLFQRFISSLSGNGKGLIFLYCAGLGAPIGSLLVGKKEFIRKARWIRKSIGGGMRQTGPIIAAAQAAFDDVYPKLSLTHDIAKELSHHFSTLGLSMVLPVDTNMLLLDLELARLKNRWLVEEGAKLGIKLGDGGRIVIHHQISAEAVAALKKAVETVVQKNGRGEYAGDEEAEVLGYGSLKK